MPDLVDLDALVIGPMSFQYDARNHYWRHENGRLFGSARCAVVESPDTDTDFKAWTAAGGQPTPWPRDEQGQQTDESMKAELVRIGAWKDGSSAEAAFTYKSDVIRRGSDAEAETLRTALDKAPAKLALLWPSITRIEHGAPEFGALRDAMIEAIGEDRADALLAPSA